MSVRGSKDLVIELTDSGAVSRDISAYVRNLNGIEIEGVTEDAHGFGEQWTRAISTQFGKISPITISGLYDDGANTPYALWSKGATRTFKVTWGGSHYTQMDVIMTKFNRSPEMEKSHKYTMTLTPSGAVTEA